GVLGAPGGRPLPRRAVVREPAGLRPDRLGDEPGRGGAGLPGRPPGAAGANPGPVPLAAIQLAAATGQNTHAWQLPWTLGEFFLRRGHWHDWAATQHTALTSARQDGDRRGQAYAHCSLGRARSWLGRYDEAHAHARQALGLFEDLGDQT